MLSQEPVPREVANVVSHGGRLVRHQDTKSAKCLKGRNFVSLGLSSEVVTLESKFYMYGNEMNFRSNNLQTTYYG